MILRLLAEFENLESQVLNEDSPSGGGHIEPALAVADAWRQKFPKSEFEFVGTMAGLENILVTGAGYKLTTIPKVTLPRSLNPAGLLAPLRFAQALSKSLQIVNGADCVVGFG